MPRVCNSWLCIAAVFNRHRYADRESPTRRTLPHLHGGESTHPVIAPLDLPSLPQAAKRAKKNFFPTLFTACRREGRRPPKGRNVGVSPPCGHYRQCIAASLLTRSSLCSTYPLSRKRQRGLKKTNLLHPLYGLP